MYKRILLDNYNRDYLIQGICFVDDYLFISSYYKGKEKHNSIITIYDKNYEYIKTCELDISSHVGGIAYDNIHNIVWLSDNGGTVTGYDKDDILNKIKVISKDGFKKVPVASDLMNYRKKPAVSYLTYYDNKLYLGNFVIFKKSELRCFNILENGKIDLDSKKVISTRFGKNIQGITFYNNFLLTSASYGKYLNSIITFYEINNDIIRKKKSKIINFRMSEQLAIKNKTLLIASEIGGNYYRGNKAYDLYEVELED